MVKFGTYKIVGLGSELKTEDPTLLKTDQTLKPISPRLGAWITEFRFGTTGVFNRVWKASKLVEEERRGLRKWAYLFGRPTAREMRVGI